MPIPANTTFDLYRTETPSTETPTLAAIPARLEAVFDQGLRALEFRYTHLLYVDLAVDIRDVFDTGTMLSTPPPDRVYIPNRDGTMFRVVFVERLHRGTTQDMKRVYLTRGRVAWPSCEL